FAFFMMYSSDIPCCYFNLVLNSKTFILMLCVCRYPLNSPAISLELLSCLLTSQPHI
ncbi:hypothetical protein L9F63_020733, partial [Diploptera punctata]